MSCSCTPSDLSKLDAVFAACADDRHPLITILQKAQAVYGWLPGDVLRAIAARTGETLAKVVGVATFYTQFRLTPVGRHLVMLCKVTACHVNGADAIEKALNALGLVDGETTADGLFSLKTVACLGCCSLSPVMMVDEDTYGSLTPEKAQAIIAEIRGKEAAR